MRRNGMLALLVAGTWLFAAGQSQAARYVRVTIKQGGEEILRAGKGDNGRISPETVWTYLKDVRFRQRYARNNFQIAPDEDNLNQATLAGKLAVLVKYGGKAKLKRLRLVRVKNPKKEPEWVIHPVDYRQLLKLRKPH